MNAYEITQLLLRESSFLSKLRETLYWTESTFDTAGRPWKTTTPDGAYVETTYSVATTGGNIGTAVTVKDQAGKLRRSITNSLGQLTRVDEPNVAGQLGASIDAPNQATIYSYDLLNNLTQVQQPGDNNEECGPSTTSCSQTRSFTYDSLSRLKQATNPESGTINYGYDLNGNLQTKTDARGIVTTYAYDALNRVKTRSYTNEPAGSETPDVSYYYDNVANAKGKLIKVASTVATTEYTSFDILGRVTASRQTTDGVAYGNGTTDSLMTYSYNLSGALIEQQYPSGRVVRNTLDSNGDLMAVLGSKATHPQFWAYAAGFKYSAAGAVTSMQLGNGNWESTTFNSRLQPTRIALGTTQNATNLLDLDYTYGTTANNGNVLSQTITVPTVGATPGFTAVQNYSYDSLNRLKQADEKPQGWTDTTCTSDLTKCWKQAFAFDRYGNRRFDEANTTMPASFANQAVTNPTISPLNNRLTSTGYSFDAAGNTTRDAQDRKLTFDAENKQTKVESLSPGTNTVTGTVGEYFYDGDGRRVKKYVPSTGETTIFVYDAAGKLVAEYSTIVASSNDAKVAYLTNDHLGSPRINTDANGAVTARHDYHPFGEEIASSHRTAGLGFGDDTVRKQFTGYERDNESELDFAEARYYKPMHGRFTSPDDFRNDTDGNDPQSWNLYIYVRNKPLLLVDPTGEFGDFYEVGTGRYLGSDGIKDDKVYAAVVSKETHTKSGDSFWFSSTTLLSITHTEFQARAATVYGESSAFRSGVTNDLTNEMMGIAYVHQTNNIAYGANNAQAQAFKNTGLGQRTGKMQLANFAVLNALTGGPDPSNGATMWDGAEQALFSAKEKRTSVPAIAPAKGTWELHQNSMGWDISNQDYATWKANVGKGFKAPQTTQAVPGTRNAGRTRLHSTAVYGRTIFWRVTP